MSQINVFTLLFETPRIHTEQIVCRFISELLNPKGAHEKGELYLKNFVTRVLNRGRLLGNENIANPLNVGTFSDATIECEHPFRVRNPGTIRPIKKRDQKRLRKHSMDIMMNLNNYYVAIEVKLTAGDSANQCQDYYSEAMSVAKKIGKTPLLYYLTKEGASPSPESIGNLDPRNIRLISFSNEILPWLEDCLNQLQTKNDVALYDLMEKFYEALKKIL